MKEFYSGTKKKTGRLSLMLVMLLCAAMIGASCWFAYTQTAKDITLDLSSVLDEQLPAVMPETDLPKETQAVRPKESKPSQNMSAEETYPETRQAAVIYAPSTPAPTEAETVVETIALARTAKHFPIEGNVLQPFSAGELVTSSTTGVWQTHNGMDIAAAIGENVYPMEAGVVSKIEEDALWGICVTIDHDNGYTSRYCGLNAGLNVMEGDEVIITDVIGVVGGTADVESAMESHLHFEVMQGDAYVDPAGYLVQ